MLTSVVITTAVVLFTTVITKHECKIKTLCNSCHSHEMLCFAAKLRYVLVDDCNIHQIVFSTLLKQSCTITLNYFLYP